MSNPSIYVCVVGTPDGSREYVTLVPPATAFSQGLIPEAIVGVLTRPLAEGESISSDNFARNSVFVKFLHEVIARHGPAQPGLVAEAKRIGKGYVFMVDQRTPTPEGAVPPEDIIGAFGVEEGEIVPGSYESSPNHRILTANGFFQLDRALSECLLQEVAQRSAALEG